jgi:hypothetical protein
VTIGISDDYACVMTDAGTLYYGYEVTDEDEEWCFEATLGELKVRIPRPELQKVGKLSDKWAEPMEFLLVGIGILLEQGLLEAKQ